MKITKKELNQMVKEEVLRAKKIKALQEQKSHITKMLNEMEMEDYSGTEDEAKLDEMGMPDVPTIMNSLQAVSPEVMHDAVVAAAACLFPTGVAIGSLIAWFKSKGKEKAAEIAKMVKAGNTNGVVLKAKELAPEIKADLKSGEGKLQEIDMASGMAGAETIQAMGGLNVLMHAIAPTVGVGAIALHAWLTKGKGKEKLAKMMKLFKSDDIKGLISYAKEIAPEVKADTQSGEVK